MPGSLSLAYPVDGTYGPSCWTVHVPDQQHDALVSNEDELAAFTVATPLRREMPGEAAVPHAVPVRSAFYDAVIRPMGGYHAAFMLPFEQGFLALCRPRTERFADAEIRRLQAMAPHFEATLRLKRHLLLVGPQVAMLGQGLEQLDIGVLIAARSGRLLYANRFAEAAMRESHDAGGRLVREMVAHADGRHRMVSRGPARPPLAVRAVPLSGLGSERLLGPPQAGVAVFLRDPEQKPRTLAAELTARLGLTPREASLAALLARDLNLAEAADALGITRERGAQSTARMVRATGRAGGASSLSAASWGRRTRPRQ